MSASRQNMAAAVNLIGSAVADPTRQFAFSNEDFKTLSKLAYEQAGIVLAESKRNLIYGRLSRRLRALNMTTFRDYRAYLSGEGGASEMQNFINSISTNHTKFFRESHHFDHFAPTVVRAFARTARSNPRTEVQLRADRTVPYGQVAALIDTVQKAGLNRIGFVTEPGQKP